jgi:hypothetical protein
MRTMLSFSGGVIGYVHVSGWRRLAARHRTIALWKIYY